MRQDAMVSDGVFDLVTLGRVGVDLYPVEDAVRLADVQLFRKSLGGSPTNVAVAGARHGLRTAVITRTGSDPFARFVRQELARLGVDDRFVSEAENAHTSLAFCEIFPPDHFPLYFYRDPISPELTITATDLEVSAIAGARAFWSTATGLSAEPSRSTHHRAWDARGRSANTILDLDYRAGFWADAKTATREIARALEKVTVAVGNIQECSIAVGQSEADSAADALLDRGVELAVVKMGPQGVLAKTATQVVQVPPTPTRVVNGLGAGDGFGGALAAGLIYGWPIEHCLRFASAAGAIVASRRECSTAMPTTDEVNELLVRSVDDNDQLDKETA